MVTHATPLGDRGAALRRIEAALDAHGCGPPKAGNWRCPAHADRTPSLSVSEGTDGRALLKCFGGCTTDAVIEALDLELRDLFESRDGSHLARGARPPAPTKPPPDVAVIGPPTSAQIAALKRAKRITKAKTLESAGAKLVRVWGEEWLGLPNLGGGLKCWALDRNGNPRRDAAGKLVRRNAGAVSIFASPDLLRRNGARVERLYDVEGESDALAMIDCGMTSVIATTGGAGSLAGHKSHAEWLRALDPREVVVIRDLDDPGRAGARKAAEWWLHRGVPVRVVELPDELGDGGDARDYLMGRDGGEALGGVADLDALADAAELRTPGSDGEEAPERDDEAPRLHVLTPEEFEGDVAPAAIVESLLYEASTHSINGASKSGKTWGALQLGMAVSAGVPFLGLATVKVSVLYLSFELSAGMARCRMRAIVAGTDVPFPAIGGDLFVIAPTAQYVPRLDLGTAAGVTELERVIGETGARLAILDTLYRFLPGADPNDNGAMGTVYGELNDLAQRSGAALLLLDHVGKGEQLGPVSHSAIGASVKGGAARVVIGLRRTSREDGGRWQLDVESHFGSWEEPLHYERPRLPDGTRGGGCVLCTASEAHGLKLATVRKLFADYGQRDALGHAFFGSKRQLIEALATAKLVSGNEQGAEAVRAIQRDYAIPDYLAARHLDREILTADGPRNAVTFRWRTAELPEESLS